MVSFFARSFPIPKSLYRPDAADLRALCETELDIVYRSILAELTAWEQRAYRDCDEIPLLADTLMKIKGTGMQPILEDWLAQNPSSERHEVVGWFLWSYWAATNQLDARLVQRMISATDNLVEQVTALHAVLFALSAAAKHKSSKFYPSLSSKLVEIRNQPKKYKLEPGILAHLESI